MTAPAWTGRRASRLTRLTLDTYGTVCHLCNLPGANTADHVICRVHGGTDSIENLRPAHMRCNSLRGTMTLEMWFASRSLAFDGREFFKSDAAATPRLAVSIFPDPPTKTGPPRGRGAARGAAPGAAAAAFFGAGAAADRRES